MCKISGISSRWTPRNVFYGWWLVGISAFIMALGSVPLFQAIMVWVVVLERRFLWTRTQLTLAFSFARVESSITGPLNGYLIGKYGARTIICVGLLILGIGFLLFSQIMNLWQFYLVFVIMSVGVGMGTWISLMTALNNWFVRYRATAMALSIEGYLVSGILLVPALAWAIDPERFGLDQWRLVAIILGLVILLVGIPVSRLIRDRPEDYGLYVDGKVPIDPKDNGGEGTVPTDPEYDWKAAIKMRTFWLITIGHSCTSIVVHTLMVHQGLFLSDKGFSLQFIGFVASAYGISSAVFTLVGGLIGDKIPIRYAVLGFSFIQGLSIFVLLVADSTAVVFLYAVLLGIGFGGRVPLIIAIRGTYFGRRSFASITGISQIPMNLFQLAAPLFAGIVFDVTGSYVMPFATIACICIFGGSLFAFLGNPKKA